ncbi:hypothetical protein [Novosphingobium lentum]|uniref:hypothetical protein n=1 Tax=Novosphingobium lentum TaxID=145287 RepID=UPI00082C27CC|nr:hypothetical protein [Novosphingobium lentum]
MPPLLTTASTLMCPHGGTVTGTPGATSATADAVILRATDSFSIAGCTFNVSGVAQPCTAIQWVKTSQKVKHGGDLVLDAGSVGLCLGPAPQGVVIVSATQAKVSGL